MKITLEVEMGHQVTFGVLGKGEVFYKDGDLFVKRTNTVGVYLTDYHKEIKCHGWTKVYEVKVTILPGAKDGDD